MSDLVEALRLEGDRRVSEKEMTFGNGKSREDRIADDLCYQAASRISQQDAELERLRREVEEVREALRECEEYFEERADAEYFHGSSIPNEEMKLLTSIRDTLKKAGA